jgi:hypothetical protein
MSKTRIIPSQVFSTGTKFVVTEKSVDGTYGPGTTGFVSYVKGRDRDYPNVVFLRVVVTKRGKSGKERFDRGELSTPIFDFKSKHLADYLPDERRRYYVHIEPDGAMPSNVMALSDIDYLGWANAYARYVYKLNSRARHMSVWPGGNKDPLNKILHLHDYYAEDPEYTKAEYAGEVLRQEFVRRIRVMEATLVRCCLAYMLKVSQTEANAISDLFKRTTKEAPIGPKTVLKATQTSYSEKSHSLEVLTMAHGKSGTVAENIAKSVSWS